MTIWQFLLGIVFAVCFCFGWSLLNRRPWDHKLGTWELDPAVRRAKRKYNYWPLPERVSPGWQRPQHRWGSHRAYCLRCGKYPFTGHEVMYSRTSGLMCICEHCGDSSLTTILDLRRYVHQVIDIKICQNFDPHFTHPDHAEPITHFIEMWRGALEDLDRWDLDRDRWEEQRG